MSAWAKTALLLCLILLFRCGSEPPSGSLRAVRDPTRATISVYRGGDPDPMVVQHARVDVRPFLHPIMAPDGRGQVTEYSPGHHKHQTGLYWGFTRVNGDSVTQDSVRKWFYLPDKTPEQKRILGRDYFHNPGDGYWKRKSFDLIDSVGPSIRWQTVYYLLDERQQPIIEETQEWTLQDQDSVLLLDLEWKGKALTDVTIGEYEYGGLFLRMPWREGIDGEVVNFARQRNSLAEGQRSLWVDVGMKVDGRNDLAHVAIFDHPDNSGFPQPWRVDGQMGIGPVRARLGDWKIPKGETEIIQHRLVVYTGELNDLQLTERWKEYIGSDNLYATAALWGIAQEEGKLAKFLTADEAVGEMTLVDGYRVNAWASEPMITQPMAFCWDDRGRLWVAENRDYESRSSGFSGSGDSRILILEDTDRDGQADKRIVFAEGISFPSAIAVGFDGLFLGAPPNLLFIPDRDRNDRGDMDDIEVRLTGWGIRDRHETINSFHWGPDGWLYGLEGFATPSKIRKPAGEGRIYGHRDPFPEDLLESEGVDINGGVWRYHPTKDRFEVVAHGFSNPWGIDYNAKGQLFISACVIPHLFHVIPGGIYHRQGGQHFNPYVYDDLKTIVDHRHRSAHGGARFYLSDAFPPDQRGRLFMANIHEHAVLSDILEKQGSGYVAHHGQDFLLANNAQWIGFSLEIGPEGAIYVLDWHDADICGKEVLQKETGRIFRIAPQTSRAPSWDGRYDDLTQSADIELVNLQESSSVWHARRARLILQNAAGKRKIDSRALVRLNQLLENTGDPDVRLRALWTLHVTGNLDQDELLHFLADADEYVRAWAVQLLCEERDAGPDVTLPLAQLARTERSAVVRLYLAAALQRLPEGSRMPLIEALVSHSDDQNDHNIPKMIWFGLEPLVSRNPKEALNIARKTTIPVIAQNIARRLVDANQLELLVAACSEKTANQLHLLSGLQAGLGNRTDIVAPSIWVNVYHRLVSNTRTSAIALEIAQQFGDAEAANRFMQILADPGSSLEDRKTALERLSAKAWPDLKPLLPGLFGDPDLGILAIRAVASYSDRELGTDLFSRYREFDSRAKAEVVLSMASRREYASLLTTAIREGKIPRSDIPAYVARQLRRVMGNGFVEVWGPIDDLSTDLEAQYSKYRRLLKPMAIKSSNPRAGKVIFERTCGSCHQMYGQGGTIGPDLTGSNRINTEYLLGNILEPGSDIQDDYRMVVITSRDGRTFLGNVTAETNRQITLKVVGLDEVVINKSDIQSREDTPSSLMPNGLLTTLTDQEVLDLIAYLRIQDVL